MTTIVCHVGVLMSDGSHFSGSLTENGTFTEINNDGLQTIRPLTSGDNGRSLVVVTAQQDSTSVSAGLELTVKATGSVQPPAPPKPTGVTLTPPALSVLNTAALGAKLCSIAVTMSDGSTFSGATSENGAVTAISGADLQLIRNLNAGDNGAVGIVVSATQNGGSAVATFNLTVVAPPVAGDGTKFITGVSPGGSRGGNGWMGMEIITGATSPAVPTSGVTSPLIVSALGRWMLPGNSQAHTIKFIDAATGLDVPGSTVTLNMAGKPPNAFAYEALAVPITLDVFHTYYLVSLEGGADELLNTGANLTYAPVGFIFAGGEWGGNGFVRWGGANTCNGPLDFIYTLGKNVNVGSPMPPPGRTDYGEADSFVMGGFGANVVSGSLIIDGSFAGFHVPAPNSVVVQYFVDGQPASPYITGPVTTGGTFPWSVNTATHPAFTNGTHHLFAKFIDSNPAAPNTKAAYMYRCYSATWIVQNPAGNAVGDYSGAQLVPTNMATTSQPYGATSPLPDFVTYPGSVPAMVPHPRPHVSVAPSRDPKYRDYGELYIEDMSSMKSQEFTLIPGWATTKRGGIYIGYSYPDTGGGTVDDFYPAAFRSPTRAGGRCQALTTPISNFIPDPRAGGDTGYLGITLQGGLIHLDYEGNVTHLAGISWDPVKPGFDNIQTRNPGDTYNFVDEDTALAQCVVKGTLDGFTADEFGGLNDLCVDPRDTSIVYLANYIDSFIIKVDLHSDPPRCSVYAGKPGTSGYVNGATSVALFDEIASILTCDGAVAGFPAGTMLVSDQGNGAIRRISPDGKTVTTLCGNQTSKPTIEQLSNPGINDTWSPPGSVSFTPGNDSTGAHVNYPWVIRLASDKSTLVVQEFYTTNIRKISLTANTITRVPNTKGAFFNPGCPNGWTWFDIDTAGVLGPVDDIALAMGATGGGLHGGAPYVRASLDGSYVNSWIGDGTGRLPEGPGNQAGTVFAPLPVYAWPACFSKTRSHFLGGGFRYYGLYAARPRAPNDPVIDLGARIGINIDVFDKVSASNKGLWWNGTSMCFPLGSRPSFTCLYGELGNALLGTSVVPSFDDLSATYPIDGDFTAEVCAPGTLGRYFQDGGAGKVPRPELTGNDLRAICYYVRRVALSGTYPKVVEPGPRNADSRIPRISGVSAAWLSNDSMGNPRIQVSWKTDKRTIGIAVAGSAAQFGTGYPYTCLSPIEGSFGTSHTAIVTGLPLSKPIHFCAIAKDVAGNSVYSDDQVIA